MAGLRETLNALLELQEIDRRIQKDKRAQASLDNGSNAESAAKSARGTCDARTDGHHKAAGELKDCELKLAGLEQKLKTYEQKLYQGTVTNAKELANIEKEIAALGRQRGDLDGRILELMDEVDEKQRGAQIARAEADAADVAHKATLEKYRAEYEQLGAEIVELTKQRADAVKQVENAALLKRYDDIRAKAGGVAIAKVNNLNCGGCNMTLPTAQIKHVKDYADIEVCENCGRLLAP